MDLLRILFVSSDLDYVPGSVNEAPNPISVATLRETGDPQRCAVSVSIESLPFEIIAMICNHAMLSTSKPTDINQKLLPALLQTSTFFRSVVLGTSSLWSFVRLECRVRKRRPFLVDKYVKEAAVHLERCRGSTLWLHVSVYDDDDCISEERGLLAATAKLRALVHPYLERCHRLDLHERYAPRSNSFLPLEGKFPQLKHLNYTSVQPRDLLFGTTFHAPSLRSVAVDVFGLHRIMNARTPAPASPTTCLNITALDLKSTSLFEFLILSQYEYSSIRLLRLSGVYTGYWDTGTQVHLQFPSLEVCSFSAWTHNTNSTQSISAPNLLHLQIRSTAEVFVLPSCLSASHFPKLATLQLPGNLSPCGKTEAFILAHPSLEVFAFAVTDARSLIKICDHLKSTARGEPGSRLQSFHCHAPDEFFSVPRALAALLEKFECLQIFWTQYTPPPTPIGWQEWHRAVGPVGPRLHIAFATSPVDLVGHFFALG